MLKRVLLQNSLNRQQQMEDYHSRLPAIKKYKTVPVSEESMSFSSSESKSSDDKDG